MADRKDLDYTYTMLDKIYRICFGEVSDFSGAKYDGDFSITLEQAQRKKHEFIAESLNIKKGSKVLDMGCGWGGFLKHLREIGGKGTGVTLSAGQAKSCKRNGFDVYLMDCRTITPDTFGTFDAISAVGSFEAFCTEEDWQAGKQDEIYNNFFKTAAGLLPVGGRLFVQTMVFGKNMIPAAEIDINAPRFTDAHMCALMQQDYPGSWLPYGEEQITKNAAPYFKPVSKNSGRVDYIETQKQWRKKFRDFGFKKYFLYLSLLPKFLFDSRFRRRLSPFDEDANRLCFEREVLDHFRLVYHKVG
ncbi:MAG: class I SAM-dependent methyltransferase [Candidatus Aminicenantes bacterium]|nr:class I SAM-dependent methyltransferase [Candidatus Aminicenantes bacterium]